MTKETASVVRGMKIDTDKKPVIGATARTLGARTPADVQEDEHGFLSINHGMSVSPLPVGNLPMHRRPKEFGGTGRDPVFELEIIHLATFDLHYVCDLDRAGHGFIAPLQGMTYNDYQIALHATRDFWMLLST